MRRVGENQALFRHVNERIGEINESFGLVTDSFAVVCECGDAGCAEQTTMSQGDYEALRSRPTQFAVKPGHAADDLEEVVDRREEYWIVEKETGAPAELAEELDPRT